MRRIIVALVLALTTAALSVLPALAGNPHFVTLTVTRSGNSLILTGKEAGLGDEQQVNIQFNASASCINPGDNHPKAANKESVSTSGMFPVQNGKAEFTLNLTATFQPECAPPMTVEFSGVGVGDLTNSLSVSFAGTF